MRTVFIGAGKLAFLTARQLLGKGHEVVIIEKDMDRIDEVSNDLAAGFIHGDGSKPAILREADPSATDFLFALTGNDQSNIIASLVGRSLGFRRVLTRIDDPAYEHICIELGLNDLVVPDHTIARHLADIVAGKNPLEVSAMVKGDARIFSFVARELDEVALADLKLPADSRVVFLYRNDRLVIPDPHTTLEKGDEVVVIAHSKVLPELQSRWNPKAE